MVYANTAAAELLDVPVGAIAGLSGLDPRKESPRMLQDFLFWNQDDTAGTRPDSSSSSSCRSSSPLRFNTASTTRLQQDNTRALPQALHMEDLVGDMLLVTPHGTQSEVEVHTGRCGALFVLVLRDISQVSSTRSIVTTDPTLCLRLMQRKAHAQQLYAQTQKARSADKQKAEFLAFICHEVMRPARPRCWLCSCVAHWNSGDVQLRNPLHAICGFTDLLLASTGLSADQLSMLQSIHHSASLMRSVGPCQRPEVDTTTM